MRNSVNTKLGKRILKTVASQPRVHPSPRVDPRLRLHRAAWPRSPLQQHSSRVPRRAASGQPASPFSATTLLCVISSTFYTVDLSIDSVRNFSDAVVSAKADMAHLLPDFAGGVTNTRGACRGERANTTLPGPACNCPRPSFRPPLLPVSFVCIRRYLDAVGVQSPNAP